MGQAKQRGTFDERRTAAVIRNEQERLDKLAADMEAEAGLSEEERERKRQARHRAATVLAMANGLIAGTAFSK